MIATQRKANRKTKKRKQRSIHETGPAIKERAGENSAHAMPSGWFAGSGVLASLDQKKLQRENEKATIKKQK